MHLDSNGEVTIAGYTFSDSAAFPTSKGAMKEDFFTSTDAYVSRLMRDPDALVYVLHPVPRLGV